MDPQLQAAYREAYLAALKFEGFFDIMSSPSMGVKAAASHTTLRVTSFQGKMNQHAGTFRLYIHSFLTSFMSPFTILPVLILLSILASLLLVWIFLQCGDWLVWQREYLRGHNDNFALNTQFMLITERKWHIVKREVLKLSNMLRYNDFVDRLLLIRQEMRIFYDRIMGNMLWIIPTSMVLLVCLQAYHKTLNGVVTVSWHELPLRFRGQEHTFVYLPRKYEGSNSHYLQHQVHSMSCKDTMPLGFDDVGKTRSERTLELASEPSKPLRKLADNVNLWCSACRQYHCCELVV